MDFEADSFEETLRLGLLAFSSNVFLMWQSIKLPYHYFPASFRDCLVNINALDAVRSSRLLLWLLMVGSITIFTEADDDAWLKPWLRLHMDDCKVRSWDQLQDVLRSFLWIDMLHDTPGRAVFESLQIS